MRDIFGSSIILLPVELLQLWLSWETTGSVWSTASSSSPWSRERRQLPRMTKTKENQYPVLSLSWLIYPGKRFKFDNVVFPYECRLNIKLFLTCNSYSKKTWQRLTSLYKTPGTRELLFLNNTVAVHLRAVEVATKEQSIDPDTHDIAIEALHTVKTEHGDCWKSFVFSLFLIKQIYCVGKSQLPAPNWAICRRHLLEINKYLDLTIVSVTPSKHPQQVDNPNHSWSSNKLSEISPTFSRNMW